MQKIRLPLFFTMSNIVNSKDSITRTDPELSKLVNKHIPPGYDHVDADIQKDRGVQNIMSFLFEMIKEPPVKINYESEFYVLQVPELLKNETDTVKNLCVFMHLRYYSSAPFRGEVDYIRDKHRQIKEINGAFTGSEIVDGCVRFYTDDIHLSKLRFVYFQ